MAVVFGIIVEIRVVRNDLDDRQGLDTFAVSICGTGQFPAGNTLLDDDGRTL
jgi:hypothetical protein